MGEGLVEAREQGLNIEARQALRREQAPVVLEAIKAAVEAARASALPGSTLGKACQYALGQWPKLIRFLDYPELELSTNLAENSIRPIAAGRNYVHSRIMCTIQGKKCMIRHIDGPFRQETLPFRCA